MSSKMKTESENPLAEAGNYCINSPGSRVDDKGKSQLLLEGSSSPQLLWSERSWANHGKCTVATGVIRVNRNGKPREKRRRALVQVGTSRMMVHRSTSALPLPCLLTHT
jgi:hypothetical protein